jgi:hypothetical protein
VSVLADGCNPSASRPPPTASATTTVTVTTGLRVASLASLSQFIARQAIGATTRARR